MPCNDGIAVHRCEKSGGLPAFEGKKSRPEPDALKRRRDEARFVHFYLSIAMGAQEKEPSPKAAEKTFSPCIFSDRVAQSSGPTPAALPGRNQSFPNCFRKSLLQYGKVPWLGVPTLSSCV